MDETQTGTLAEINEIANGETETEKMLKLQQEQWISFCALGGLITLESDNKWSTQDIHQMTVTEFSETIGVARRTLYNWKKQIPNFGEKVRERRNEVFSLSRESVLFNRAYMIAMTSNDHKAAGEMIKMLLGHGANLELPAQRHEIEAGQNLMDLVNIARKKNIIEGETIEPDSYA